VEASQHGDDAVGELLAAGQATATSSTETVDLGLSAVADRGRSLNILVLADRDWTHPQGGGTGANVYSNVIRWADWGHRVTLVAGAYPGCLPVEEITPNLFVHRMGGRGTVFPRAAWAVSRGLGREADVVFEVINGIVFLGPLWLRKPIVALVNHPHRDLFVGEFGSRLGRLLAALLEELPLRLCYRRIPFLTISGSARDELVSIDRIPAEHITIAYCGVEPPSSEAVERSSEPRLLYVGRLKAYKRIEFLLDALGDIPGATLDIAGQGDHGETLDEEISRRGLGARVRVHGFVEEEVKLELYQRAWVHVTASASEGWSLTVMEAAQWGTPSVALAVGGLRESIVDGKTGLLAQTPADFTQCVRKLIEDRELRERLGEAARERASTFTWDRTAATMLEVVVAQASGAPQPGRRRRRAARA
jgi:glycosyltransferase involved in cell wall biosynthesis